MVPQPPTMAESHHTFCSGWSNTGLGGAWDAQADVELAMRQHTSLVLSSYDFRKYFDTFHYKFTKDMLTHCGMDKGLIQMPTV